MNIALHIIAAAAYIGIASLVFMCFRSINEELKQRKHYKKHPERYGVEPVWKIAIISILWPLQLIGAIIDIIDILRRPRA